MFPGFKLADALAFAASHGLNAQANEARSVAVHPSIRNQAAVRKGYLVDVFERSGLLDEFAAQYWPSMRSDAGQRFREKYLMRKALNERLLGDESANEEIVEDAELEVDDVLDVTFGLEQDLQRALRDNIGQLEPGLRITDGGKEQVTGAGRIDISAEDQAGARVLVELKAIKAPPEALTQLLGYMGALSGQDDRKIRGILVAPDFHERVIFAARATPNVQLRRYRFRFTFEAIE